jgi:hypothetical protein
VAKKSSVKEFPGQPDEALFAELPLTKAGLEDREALTPLISRA